MPTPKILFINYYRDSDPNRRHELLTCVENNLKVKAIAKYVIYVEDMDYINDLPKDDRITYVYLPRRMEFRDCIDYAHDNFKKSIIIITNLDIYLEQSDIWHELDDIIDGTRAMVLTRYNLDTNLQPYREEPYWTNGNFCDTWIMKTPIPDGLLKEDLNFCVGGAPQCDNLMMYLMTKYWHTYSWGEKFKTYHYDVCRKANETKIIYNDKTDYRAVPRKDEHINIPAYQDWQHKLETGEQPIIKPCWHHRVPKYLKPIKQHT